MRSEGQGSSDTIWVARIIDQSTRIFPGGPILSTVATFGVIPTTLTGIFLFLNRTDLEAAFVISQLLITSVPILGAFFIWHYNTKLFPRFLEQTSEIVDNKDGLADIVERYKIFFSERFWLSAIPWTILAVSAVIANIKYFQELGIAGYQNVSFLVYLVFFVWFGLITGIGLHMVATTILCIREIGDLDLQIDPLHPDQLGGLSNIGMFAIRTTMMNSIGALALPLAFTMAAPGAYELLIYIVVAVYIVFILFSFLYPTIYVNEKAESIREAELERRREQLQAMRNKARKSPNPTSTGQISPEEQLHIQTIKEEFQEYQDVRLYPFTLSILTRLASSILLPIVFMLLETYVISS